MAHSASARLALCRSRVTGVVPLTRGEPDLAVANYSGSNVTVLFDGCFPSYDLEHASTPRPRGCAMTQDGGFSSPLGALSVLVALALARRRRSR